MKIIIVVVVIIIIITSSFQKVILKLVKTLMYFLPHRNLLLPGMLLPKLLNMILLLQLPRWTAQCIGQFAIALT